MDRAGNSHPESKIMPSEALTSNAPHLRCSNQEDSLPNAFHNDFSDRVSSEQLTGSNRRRRNRKGRSYRLPALPSLPKLSKLSLRLPKLSLQGKMPSFGRRPRIPSPGWFPLAGAGIGFAAIMLFVSTGGQDVDANVSIPQEEWVSPTLLPEAEELINSTTTTLKSGDNAISALVRLGFDHSTSHFLISIANATYKLKNIRAGQSFKRVDSSSSTDIYYNVSGEKRLHLQKENSSTAQWQATLDERTVYSRKRFASGTIQDSLFTSAEAAGMDQRTTMNLVDIFAWDIDFARDLRNGDSFQVAYEERYDDEGKMLESSILAAEFTNQGNQFRAVRYEQANGKIDYFTPEGKSMRKAYLKAPVKFSRISSTFKTKRKHPVLGYTRAHRGVDYASPSGTPIHAIGDGFVTFVGWKGGYGRYVQIRHNNRNHTTSYAHMRSYAKGLKRGMKVRQGKIIGYVGMSGLATGPHLHFEFRSRGRAVNPLTVKHPPAQPVATTERQRFQAQTAPLLGSLKENPVQLAWD